MKILLSFLLFTSVTLAQVAPGVGSPGVSAGVVVNGLPGTVTSVSVITANGVSGTVATPTTTPAITLTLGAIVPTSVNGNTITTGTGTLTLGSATLNAGVGGTLGTAAFTAASAYEVPLTFSTGLTRSTNTITVNSTQSIAKLSNLTSNGFVKTGSGDGTLSIDTNTYLTGNQTVTLTGDTTGSGATSIATTTVKINGVSLAGLATGILKNTTTTGAPSIAVAGDFPTLNQNTTGNAATATALQTARTINGTSFDGTANVGQDLRTTASPTFVGATFSGAVSGITTLSASGVVSFIGGSTGNTNGLLKLQRTDTDYGSGISMFYSSVSPNASARAWQLAPNFIANGNLDVLISASNSTQPTTAVAAFSSTGLAVTGTVSATNGIVGTTTNDNAPAGSVGQYVSSLVAIGSPQSLSNNTAANITSISLTAGDWDVSGVASFTETTSTVTARVAGISSTSATLPTDGSEAYCGVQSTVTSETNSIPLTRVRFSLSGTTIIYLVAKANFSAGTCGGFGQITARRVR